MQNSNHGHWWKIMHNPFVMIVAIVALFFLTRSAWNMHRSADLVSTKLSQTTSELEKLQSEQVRLTSEIDALSTPSGVESQLRTKYRAVKEGESVAVIINKEPAEVSSSTTSVEQKSWFGRVLSWFGL